jgi:DTW domain-containing protein YfiP
MRSATDLTNRCVRCLVRRDLCLCAEVVPVATATRFVVVRHVLEKFRSTNTGRIALLGLTNAALAEFGGTEESGDLGKLIGPDAALLFPDGGRTVTQTPRTVVVVDGSWSQARRMVQRVPVLRSLPRLALPLGEALPRLRAPTRPDGLSTIEAMTRALALLEGEAAATPLADLCRLHAARSRAAKGIVADDGGTEAGR